MAFLYFFPGHAGVIKRADFEARGLGYALGAAGDPDSAAVAAGPDGKPGVLAVVPPAHGAAYKPDQQRWRNGPSKWVEGKELAYAVGYSTARPPGPADLIRGRVVAGETVRLLDGNDWTIPIARSVVRGSTLPKELVLGDDLKSWSPQDLPEYLGLCADAELAFKWLHGGEPDAEGNVTVSIPYSDGMRIAVAALAVNYRVSALEVALARLFGDVEMEAVLKAVCDFPTYEEMLADRKKKEPASAT